jgi:predicted RNase H-like nuclease (RuvC/YqgF family)
MANKYKNAIDEINRFLDCLYDDRTPISQEVISGITVEELINLLEYTKSTLENLIKEKSNG